MHLTIQFSALSVFNTERQKMHDCEEVLSTGSPIIMGTERYDKGLRKFARENNQRLYLPKRGDGWVAVDRDVIDGPVVVRYLNVLQAAKAIRDPHPYGPKGIPMFRFDHKKLGRIWLLGGVHYLTKGSTYGQSRQDNPKCPISHRGANQRYAHTIVHHALKLAKGKNLVFIAGDSNMKIKWDHPMFHFGETFPTCWNDTNNFPNTGHGCIDFIARCKADTRVGKAIKKKTGVMKNLRLHSDHKTIRATYNIKPL